MAEGICPACEKDSDFYRLTRKKGDPRQFIPYPALLDQWRRRRAECRDWRLLAEQAATDRTARQQVERENSCLWAVLNALNADLDPALALAAELDKTRAELERTKAQRDAALRAGNADSSYAEILARARQLSGGSVIPTEQWRRLVQLAHPDKHGNSLAAAEATRWLLENRP